MELIEFIKKYKPTFENEEGLWKIFTCATQWVEKPTLEEALEFCYWVIETRPILKYPTLGELCKAFKDGTLPKQDWYNWRLDSNLGYKPGIVHYSTIAEACSPEAKERNNKYLTKLYRDYFLQKENMENKNFEQMNELIQKNERLQAELRTIAEEQVKIKESKQIKENMLIKQNYDLNIIKKWTGIMSEEPNIAKLNKQIEEKAEKTLNKLNETGTIVWGE